MSETYVSHTKPWSRMQSLSESRGGSKVTKPIFSNSIKRYCLTPPRLQGILKEPQGEGEKKKMFTLHIVIRGDWL